jgi:hypothetical protein
VIESTNASSTAAVVEPAPTAIVDNRTTDDTAARLTNRE